MRCIIREVILIENFDKRSNWSAEDMEDKEMTKKQKKIIIKLSNSNRN